MLLLVLLLIPCAAFGAELQLVDGFEDASLWSAHPADGVKLALAPDGGVKGQSLRLTYEFSGGGYAVVHRKVDLELPENYAFSFRMRGQMSGNHLEFKLIDESGENVWWYVFRDFNFGNNGWQTFIIKKRKIQFAWGPKGGGEISHVAAIEFSITAARPASGAMTPPNVGTVWLDELEVQPLPPPSAVPPQPKIRASSGDRPESAWDGIPSTGWRASKGDKRPWIELDFQEPREFGGLVVDWEKDADASYYVVESSMDGESWSVLRHMMGGNGGRDYLYLPESESRLLRVATSKSDGGMSRLLRMVMPWRKSAFGIRELIVKPLEWSASKEAFFKAVAMDAPRGAYPRGFRGEPSVWTVVGPLDNVREGLLSGDGVLESAVIDRGMKELSIEPFLFVGGRLLTWADVDVEQSLERGYLPIPSVIWKTPDLKLTTTALANHSGSSSGAWQLLSRYRVENTSSDRLKVLLFLAIRPFQVNPPSQALNTPGGCAPIRDLEYASGEVRSTTRFHKFVVRSLVRPDAFGAVSFDAGDLVTDYLSRGVLPPEEKVVDAFEAASGALAYQLNLAPYGHADVDLAIPITGGGAGSDLYIGESIPEDLSFDQELKEMSGIWEYASNQISISVPGQAQRAVDVFRSQLNYILVNRYGAAIQPGSRAYARSWIRDGSLTSSAVLRTGRPEVVNQFIEFFGHFQYPNGKIPCVVDYRGADPVPEHDSTGEFLFLIAEYYRFTKDSRLVEQRWPGIVNAVAYLDSLRQERLTSAYQSGANAKFYGILPPSISHEGYSAKPMHSYWDDFFALRGFKDAAYLAKELGHKEYAKRFGAIRDAFAKDLGASIAAAMKDHNIDYVPGCADLGDFDATSTTIALSPAEATFIPRSALEATFERYYEFFTERKNGAPWEAFTPYEIRNIGAFVRLGWRDRAHELLEYFLDHQTPKGWNQWAEVVWRDTTIARFIGDMPHTWVGSDYMRSFLDFFAYDREADQSLVLMAGIPSDWVRQEDGVSIKDLRTQYGPLSYRLVEREGVLEANIDKLGELPPGGLVLRPPLSEQATKVTVNGKREKVSAQGEVVLKRVPAVVRWAP